MVVQHQTYSPSTCECIVELQYDDAETVENREVTLWFFHKICQKHQPLVKDKKKIPDGELKAKRESIIKHHEKLLKDNRERHLATVDEHLAKKLNIAAELKKSLATEKHALNIEAQAVAERAKTVTFLDNHETQSMDFLVTGLFSENSLNAQEVYDAIMAEQKEANPIVD